MYCVTVYPLGGATGLENVTRPKVETQTFKQCLVSWIKSLICCLYPPGWPTPCLVTFSPTLNQLITFCNPTSNFSSSFWKPSPNTSFRISTHLSTSSYRCYAFHKSLLCERNLLIPLNPSHPPTPSQGSGKLANPTTTLTRTAVT